MKNCHNWHDMHNGMYYENNKIFSVIAFSVDKGFIYRITVCNSVCPKALLFIVVKLHLTNNNNQKQP